MGGASALSLNQDVTIHAALLDGAESVDYHLAPGRRAYIHVARGRVYVNGTLLGPGDAAKVVAETVVALDRGENAELLLFDLP